MPNYHINPELFDPNRVSEIPNELQEQFGRGLTYPTRVLEGNHWQESVGEDKINQSMLIVLLTPLGTRIMQPDFGSMIPYMIFERVTPKLQNELEFYAKRSLERWEPRIDVLSVKVDTTQIDNNTINLIIMYRIKGIDGKRLFRVPMKLDQGTPGYSNPSQFEIGGRQVF